MKQIKINGEAVSTMFMDGILNMDNLAEFKEGEILQLVVNEIPSEITVVVEGSSIKCLDKNTESQYLGLLEHIVTNGETKENRTGIDTLVIPPVALCHTFEDGSFPLLTTKKMATKTMATELQGFIGGITDKNWFKERKCRIWNEWARQDVITNIDESNISNEIKDLCTKFDISIDDVYMKASIFNESLPNNSSVKNLKLAFQFFYNDLGPIYGYQWRNFNKEYTEIVSEPIMGNESMEEAFAKGDQFDHMIHQLKTNPDDRRMKVEAWNFLQYKMQALPSCHSGFTVQHINGTLHLTWDQRSCDVFYGIPFNLASYCLLLLLICKETNMKPGSVTGFLVDVHVYKNQLEMIKEQLSRPRYPLPKVSIDDSKWNGIYNFDASQVIVEGYQSHGPLRDAQVAI